jgi:tRNA(His) 5'-end guanylyltransferase
MASLTYNTNIIDKYFHYDYKRKYRNSENRRITWRVKIKELQQPSKKRLHNIASEKERERRWRGAMF